jgi:hypothetical protein
MSGRQPNWQLILDAAEALTASGQAPFSRISVYEWIWRRYPRSDHDRPSLDPTFQGMIGNAPGGPPSPCGAPLRRTNRGQYILAGLRQDDRSGAVARVDPGTSGRLTGHAFISYVREDSAHVDRMQELLERAGIPVWRDVAHLWPGQDWRAQIRTAITRDALVFLACFSRASARRAQSYQNEELNEAIGQVRRRPHEVTWLIPVRFDDCQLPGMDIGGGRDLHYLQSANLFGQHYHHQAERLVQTIRGILHGAGTYSPSVPVGFTDRPPEISIAEPGLTDRDFRPPMQSVVHVDVAEPLDNLTAALVADQTRSSGQGTDRRSASDVYPEPQTRSGADKKPGFYGVQPDPETITASVVIQPAGRGNYDRETGNRVVIAPIYSPYPLFYEPDSRHGETPKLFLLVGVPDEACRIGSIIHTRHVNGTQTATIDWQVVHPHTVRRNLPRWHVKAIEATRPR